jgi:hypothetical protein
MDDDKVRLIATGDAGKPGGPRYVFKDEPLKLSAPPETPPTVLTSADFRNAEIERAIKTLEQLERRFREGSRTRSTGKCASRGGETSCGVAERC